MWYLVGETAGRGRDLGPLLVVAFAAGASKLASNDLLAEAAWLRHVLGLLLRRSVEPTDAFKMPFALLTSCLPSVADDAASVELLGDCGCLLGAGTALAGACDGVAVTGARVSRASSKRCRRLWTSSIKVNAAK